MSFVRTVLGDIAPETLGVCYAHEHVIIDASYMTRLHPDFLLDSVEIATEELCRFRADGGRAMIDSMPAGGRNAAKLAEVSRRSGVHIICPTGLHLANYYPDDFWANECPAEELAERFLREIETGIDANDWASCDLAPLPQRAGLIKIATGGERLDEREQRLFAAAAQAHRRTGCPILTHTEQGMAGLAQAEHLLGHGVRPESITLSHTDRRPDVAYHRAILETGVNLEYDSAFRWKPGQGNPTRELIEALFADFPGQLMLGMDAARRGYWKGYGGGPGMSYLLTEFAADFPQSMRHQLFVINPARAYAFVPPPTRPSS